MKIQAHQFSPRSRKFVPNQVDYSSGTRAPVCLIRVQSQNGAGHFWKRPRVRRRLLWHNIFCLHPEGRDRKWYTRAPQILPGGIFSRLHFFPPTLMNPIHMTCSDFLRFKWRNVNFIARNIQRYIRMYFAPIGSKKQWPTSHGGWRIMVWWDFLLNEI